MHHNMDIMPPSKFNLTICVYTDVQTTIGPSLSRERVTVTDAIANDHHQGSFKRTWWRMLLGNNMLWNWSMFRLVVRVYMLSVLLLLLGSTLFRTRFIISSDPNFQRTVCMQLDSLHPYNSILNRHSSSLLFLFQSSLESLG